uniref:Nucleoside diphosphate kinase n=1 Tax=Neogobius melanostomus TaxID=47308 RepID=A0A8C6UHJ0_9GOBI
MIRLLIAGGHSLSSCGQVRSFFFCIHNATLKLYLFSQSQLCRLFFILFCFFAAGVPSAKERTFIAVKPDGVQRRLVGQVIHRFERRGFKLVGLKLLQVLITHYCQLTKKPFYPDLVEYMTSGPVVAMVWEGPNIVQTCRMMVGHTNPAEAHAGTIRADFSLHVSRNVVHASDSLEGAQREIMLWFDGHDLLKWDYGPAHSTT